MQKIFFLPSELFSEFRDSIWFLNQQCKKMTKIYIVVQKFIALIVEGHILLTEFFQKGQFSLSSYSACSNATLRTRE